MPFLLVQSLCPLTTIRGTDEEGVKLTYKRKREGEIGREREREKEEEEKQKEREKKREHGTRFASRNGDKLL